MKKYITCIAFLVIFMLSFSFFACAQKPTNYVFVCPDGAPAIATYAVMDSKNIDFIVYDNSQAVSSISADMASNKADFALLPINLATKMVKHGYKAVGVLTHGNLYGISRATINSLDDLKGKKVGVIQLNAVPGFTIKLMLDNAQIEYTQTLSEMDENKVFLRAIDATPDAVKSLLDYSQSASEENKLDLCIVAEPMCNTLINRFGFSRSLSVQDEYGNFPQAVFMVKNSVLIKDRALVNSMISKMQACDYSTLNAQEVVDTISSHMYNSGNSGEVKSSLNANALTVVALDKSNIYYEGARENKIQIEKYINALKKFNTTLGSVVEDIDDTFFA